MRNILRLPARPGWWWSEGPRRDWRTYRGCWGGSPTPCPPPRPPGVWSPLAPDLSSPSLSQVLLNRKLELQQSCSSALCFSGWYRVSHFLAWERFFKKSWIMFRWSLDTWSVHILNIELKKSLFSTEIVISGNLPLWLGHLTCSKLIFYGRIGYFHISKKIFIISGEHYIKKSDF